MPSIPNKILRRGLGGVSISDTSTHDVRLKATGLLSAKMIESLTGNSNILWEDMQGLMEDPEMLGAITLSILNLFFAWCTTNGTNIKPMHEIIEYQLKTLKDPNG